MNRKGVSLTVMLALLLFAVVMLIIVFIYKKVEDVGSERFTESQCQTSLELTQKFDAYQPTCFVKAPNPVALHCNRDFLTVKDDSVVKNGDDATSAYDAACPTKIGPGKTPNACLPENAVAQSMYTCWHTFFDGQVPVFQQVEEDSFNKMGGLFGSSKDARACFVCSEITLSTQKNIMLRNYLQYTTLSDGKTYYEHFTDPKSLCDRNLVKDQNANNCFEAIAHQWDVNFFTKDVHTPDVDYIQLSPGKYAVVFVRRSTATCDSTKILQGKESPITETVQIVPVDKIKDFCNTVLV